MITGDIIKLFNECIKKIGLQEWTINLSILEEDSTVQFNSEGYFSYINNNLWGISYSLPTSKLAEIYLFPGHKNLNLKKILLHELLHIKYSPDVYTLMTNIEKNSKYTPKQAREEHRKLRELEHEVIDAFLPTYLK